MKDFEFIVKKLSNILPKINFEKWIEDWLNHLLRVINPEGHK